MSKNSPDGNSEDANVIPLVSLSRDSNSKKRRQENTASTSTTDAIVFSFPTQGRNAADSDDGKGEACETNTDGTVPPTTRPSTTGATSPRTSRRSPKRTRRGPKPTGVPMPFSATPGVVSPESPVRPATVTKSNKTSASRTSEPLGVLMPNLLAHRVQFTGRGAADLGSLTHALVESHVQFLTRDTCDDCVSGKCGPGECDSDECVSVVREGLLNRMYAVAYAAIDANPNATRVLATEAAGLAFGYLATLVPAAPWRLLGVEYDTGDGRVDLAWIHDDGRVFFDELKTSRIYNPRNSNPAWVRQTTRYAQAGAARFGALFEGTRLVALNGADDVRLVRAGLPIALLAATPGAPLRPARNKRVTP